MLENRKDQYEEVFTAELRAFERGALERLETGLWRSARPLDRQRLGQLASLRGEMAPLIGPYEDYDEFLEGVRSMPQLPVTSWSLFHVRLNDLATGTPRSMVSVESRVPFSSTLP